MKLCNFVEVQDLDNFMKMILSLIIANVKTKKEDDDVEFELDHDEVLPTKDCDHDYED
jgi:hypothetical protein